MAEPHSSHGSLTFNLRRPPAGDRDAPDLPADADQEPAPSPEESPLIPANREQLLASLREQQRRLWRDGRRPSIDSLLSEHPELLGDPLIVFELLWGEFLLREEEGDEPTLAEYHERYPSYGPTLEVQLRLHQALRDAEISRAITQEGVESLPAPPAPIPEIVGGYEILSELGRGGMGVVFRARHRQLHRVVALKMILSARFACQEELLRFRLEAETASSLQHPNIVQVYEVGSHQGQPYMVLEYVKGGTLATRLDVERLTIQQAVSLVEVLARAVQVAHNHGIIHRDLKPSNILLQGEEPHAKTQRRKEDKEGSGEQSRPPFGSCSPPDSSFASLRLCVSPSSLFPKITDFGLAKHIDRVGGLTETGRILGTPEYMAPEQASGRSSQIGPAADIYALGAILYELLAGRPPFQSTGSANTLLQVLVREAVPLRKLQSNVPRDLETICARCLEKEPAKRYSSAVELADDLERFLAGEPIHARPIGPVERLCKWARRRPVVAGLLACLVAVTVLGFAGVTGALWYALEGWNKAAFNQLQAEEERETAKAERAIAQSERAIAQSERALAVNAQFLEAQARQKADRALLQAETNLTFSRLAQAEQMWQLNKLEASSARLALIDTDHRGWVWRHLDGLHRSELRLLSRPQDVTVLGVAFSPDGKHLATAGGNPYLQARNGHRPSDVSIWETSTCRLLGGLPGALHITERVAYSTDGRFLAGWSRDGSIRIWSARTGQRLRVLPVGATLRGDIAWCPLPGRTSLLASVGSKGKTLIHDVQTGKIVDHRYTGDVGGNHVAWSPDGRYLASDGAGVRVWKWSSGEEVLRLKVSGLLAFSPDSSALAVVSDSVVRLYSVSDRKIAGAPIPLTTFNGHVGRVSGLAFSPDGLLLATSGADSTVRIWNVEDGRELSTWRGHQGRVECVCFHPSGAVVVSGSAQPGDVRCWDLTRDQRYTQLPDGRGWIDALTFSTSGKEVVTQRRYGDVEAQDVMTGQRKFLHHLPIHSRWHTPGVLGAFSGDVRTLIATAALEPSRARAWDVASGKPLPGSYQHGNTRYIWHVSCSHDGKVAVSSARDDRADVFSCDHAVWEPHTGKVLWRFEESSVRVMAMILSPDGRALARSVTDMGSSMLANGVVRTRPISARIDLWQIPASGQPAPREPWLSLRPGEFVVHSLAFSSDGKILAACTPDARVRLWSLPSGKLLHDRPLVGPFSLESLAFSPDGRLLAGATRTSVVVWDVHEGQELLSLSSGPPRTRDQGFSPRLAWSGDGRRLAATNWTQRVTVWDGLDLSQKKNREEMFAAAVFRLPRWHLEIAQTAASKGQRSVVDFHLRELERLGPLDPGCRLRRGELLASLGQWDKATDDLAVGVENSSGQDSMHCFQYAVLQVRSGKKMAYRKQAELILDQFSETGEMASLAQALLACSVLPGSIKDMDRLVRAAQRLPRGVAWCDNAAALAYLRAGRDDEAIRRCESSERILGMNPHWRQNRVLNWLTLALAHHHKGNAEQARKWWNQSREWFAAEEKKLADSGLAAPTHLEWQNWLWMLQLRAEVAKSL